ncbi:EAL domain-containing protein [Achromobacter aegrifaciens]
MKILHSGMQRFFHYFLVAAAMGFPVLMIFPLVKYQGEKYAEAESSIMAVTVQRQLDGMLRLVEKNTKKAIYLLEESCEGALPELTHLGTLTPYFRSLLLIRKNALYCSSVAGDTPGKSIVPLIPVMEPGFHISPVPGTPLVPDRPALIVSYGVSSGLGVIAIIDGQYLRDIEGASGQEGQFQVRIIHAKSQRPLLPEDGHPDAVAGDWKFGKSVKSALFPFEVHVDVAPRRIASYFRELWTNYAPFLLLAASLMGYLAHRIFLRRLSLTTEIRKGMSQNEFFMAYQPLVDLASGEFCGVEALVRWHRPGRERISPDIFIPLAEENGLMAELTRHILKLIERDFPKLPLRKGDHLGINISGSHLIMREFVEDFREFMDRVRASQPLVVLELTEREGLLDVGSAQESLRKVKAHGALLALDDFGTGHSSVSYLASLEVDFIKLDRSYVQGADTKTVGAVLLDTIIDLGHQLETRMIAEGVETQAQATYLRRRGVQMAQGYFYARALRAEELADWKKEYEDLRNAAAVLV